MGELVVVGSYNRDLVVRLRRFPRPGETVGGEALAQFHGGKGSNQAVQAARCGAAVRMVAALGADAAGEAALALWAGEGIGTGAVRRHAGAPTGTAVILVQEDGENEIVVVPGANALLAAADAASACAGAAVVIAQLETPAAASLAAFRAARAAGALTLLNATPAAEVPEELLALADLLLVNETEAALLVGAGAPMQQARTLGARHARGAVVTAGAAGAFWGLPDGAVLAAAPPRIAVRDTTGAGDACAGALAAALAAGCSAEAALRRGVVAGALACTREGAVPSLPHMPEIAAAGG